MPRADLSESNRISWANLAKSPRRRYAPILYEGATWQHNVAVLGWPQQRVGIAMLEDAIALLVTGHAQQADLLFAVVEEMMEDTLQSENFDKGSTVRVLYDDETARVRGTALCLETQHNAHWYRTGEKNPAQLRDASAWYIRFLEKHYRKNSIPVEKGLWRLILAEDYDEAIAWYHSRFRKALPAPVNDKRYTANSLHALYFLAEYARGNREVLPVASAGIKRWYNTLIDCRYFHPDHLFEEQVAWFYFWHHYFHGRDDIRNILIDSRGY